MNLRPLSRGILLVVVSLLMLVHTAAAYVGQNPYAVHLDGPVGVVGCKSEVVITATVRGADTGQLVSNQTVVWDITTSRSTGDSLSSRSSITGPDGKTSVTLRFGPVEGTRTVRAMIATWPATIDVTCRGGVPLPTATPTDNPTAAPTGNPTATPTAMPSTNPSAPSTVTPTSMPSAAASASVPPATPTASVSPDSVPTATSPDPANSGPIATDPNAPGSAPLSSPGPDLMLAVVAVALALGLGALVLVRAAGRR